jgi:WhiB family redox-sensing transcriptional regulator
MIAHWQDYADCTNTDPDAFFAEVGVNTPGIRAICETCPVTAQCLEVGMHYKFGFFGGKSVAERRAMRART